MRAALTKRIVASAQPRERPYELRDAQVRGLLLRVQPSGHKAWIVTWAHGKRRTLGSAGHLSLDQARDIAVKVIAEFIQTGLPRKSANAIASTWISSAAADG
ncbi:MAG TPA: integrase arm-type DNA-binding domain-containing protein [Dyella sp.]|uniref:Arm DNA-binding domain-containing protein n=1 Tax=Dyella sp. TaxID=1869338 RepID=UPI002D77B485|nr:integrase arm-type DNA-binding domain-containing protein [Dyella sp.]HET6552983.1 integrase arm-type DNA-binding domain-containing protein [Dyella sp.]